MRTLPILIVLLGIVAVCSAAPGQAVAGFIGEAECAGSKVDGEATAVNKDAASDSGASALFKGNAKNGAVVIGKVAAINDPSSAAPPPPPPPPPTK